MLNSLFLLSQESAAARGIAFANSVAEARNQPLGKGGKGSGKGGGGQLTMKQKVQRFMMGLLWSIMRDSDFFCDSSDQRKAGKRPGWHLGHGQRILEDGRGVPHASG